MDYEEQNQGEGIPGYCEICGNWSYKLYDENGYYYCENCLSK